MGSISEDPEVPAQLVCAECRRRPLPNQNGDDDWRAYSDGADD